MRRAGREGRQARKAASLLRLKCRVALRGSDEERVQETSDANLWPIAVQMKDRERVEIPLWAGTAAAATGRESTCQPARQP